MPHSIGFYIENVQGKDLFMMVSVVALAMGMILLFSKKK